MINQSSLMFLIVCCMMHISIVTGTNLLDNFEFPQDFQTPIKESNSMIETERNTLDCTQFRLDLDILRSFPFAVEVSPAMTVNKTFALMNDNNQVTALTIHKEKFVPLNVYCLKNLNSLIINNTRFYEFALDDQSIQGIPKQIGLLTSLKTLHIYNTPVQHLPNEFRNLTLLTNLIIENGFLQELPAFIGNLSLLQSIKLSNNKLKSLPSTFVNLRNLQYLWLDNNQLTSINQLNGNAKLENLYAQNCNIIYLPNNIPRLINLNMSYNHLEDLTNIGTLGISSSWKSFDFSYNQIDLIPPQISRIVYYLRNFSVKHNQLTHLPNASYGLANQALTRLDISENSFTDDELNSIKAIIRARLPLIQFIY